MYNDLLFPRFSQNHNNITDLISSLVQYDISKTNYDHQYTGSTGSGTKVYT